MAAIDFPNTPTVGQVFSTTDRSWIWTGTRWDAYGSPKSQITASDTPPVSPQANQLWYESDTGKTFIFYDNFWVEISAPPSVAAAGLLTGDTLAANVIKSSLQINTSSSLQLNTSFVNGVSIAGFQNVGIFVCTSSTRPSPAFGVTIFETDTKRTYQYDGSTWVGIAGPIPWTTLPLINGWSDYSYPAWQGAGYRKVGDTVQMRGLIKGGSTGIQICSFGAGYQPTSNLIYATSCDQGGGNIFARIEIQSNGGVWAYWVGGLAATFLSINMQWSVA